MRPAEAKAHGNAAVFTSLSSCSRQDQSRARLHKTTDLPGLILAAARCGQSQRRRGKAEEAAGWDLAAGGQASASRQRLAQARSPVAAGGVVHPDVQV